MDLLLLDKYNREATLGVEYYKLNNEYSRWSIDLHKEGHIMDTNELEYIALHGLIGWYLEKQTNINIYYNYYLQLLYFINKPNKICYDDWIQINKLAKYINIPTIFHIDKETKHNELIKYNKTIFNKYMVLRWGCFLIDTVGKKELIIFLDTLYNKIKNDNHLKKSYYDLFLEKHPEIKNYGIIYHRLKIVLEKYSIYKLSLNDIYKLDYIVDYVQRIIYTICMNYSININYYININNNINIKINKLIEPLYVLDTELINDIYKLLLI